MCICVCVCIYIYTFIVIMFAYYNDDYYHMLGHLSVFPGASGAPNSAQRLRNQPGEKRERLLLRQ